MLVALLTNPVFVTFLSTTITGLLIRHQEKKADKKKYKNDSK